MDDVQVLSGGNASGEVVRVGTTVRKPWSAATPSVFAFMTALRDAGVDVPTALGRDEHGRQITEFVPGRLAMDSYPLSPPELHRVGSIVRAIHDASETFTPAREASWSTAIPAPAAELICHNDLAPWNLIIGERWVFIDWDAAAPSTRLWDLAYAAQSFTLNVPTQPPAEAAHNLASLVAGYGATTALRRALPTAMHRRAAAMYELLRSSHDSRVEPWGTMFVDGHGAHWQAVTEYVERHQATWSEALVGPEG